MSGRNYRPALALAALGVALLGASTLFLEQSNAASGPYTIEINEQGFNPPICQINRNDEVVWKNVGTQVHRVIRPDAGVGSPPLFDTEDIAPGQTSSRVVPGVGGQLKFYDYYNMKLMGIVQSPQRSETGPISCSPLPPTPVPTPTRDPSKEPTPTPSPVLLANCRARALGAPFGLEGCALVPALAADQ